MAMVLRENAKAEGLSNIDVVGEAWEDTAVVPHDVARCSHAIYLSPDLVGFVRKMEQVTLGACFLLMRVPSHNGVMAQQLAWPGATTTTAPTLSSPTTPCLALACDHPRCSDRTSHTG